MRKMNPVVDIGLPNLDAMQIDSLAEDCEKEASTFILNEVPSKSIDDLSISCILDLEEELELTIDIDIVQKYETGHDLEDVMNRTSAHVFEWLERKLRGMK